MKKGLLIILSGPSGVGKGTVRKYILENFNLSFYYSISMTTRAPRAGEVDGKDYYFVTPEEFQRKIDEGNLLEWAEFVNNRYGTPRDIVESYRNQGIDVLLEIETNGAKQVMAKCPDAVSIFLVPPSLEELEARIRGRKSETEASIQKRMAKAAEEMKLAANYKYVVSNDSVERAAGEIRDIILRARG
ncbi:MAG: guanylate kinase [Bacilli bacterium]|nr:guanylate kinase [Bacilli bacterium]